MNDQISRNWRAAILIMLTILFIRAVAIENGQTVTLPYSEFDRLSEAGEIERMTVSDTTITGSLKSPIDGASEFRTYRVDADFVQRYENDTTELEATPPANWFVSLLAWIGPFVLLLGFWMLISRFLMRGSAGQYMSIGENKAKIFVETETGVTFDDVAGVDEAKAELMEVVDFLRRPDDYKRLGAHIPKGVLLIGPPGTGKTLLARAVAGEAGVAFYSISGSEFVELFVGVGAARVRDLFAKAKASSPSIIFIDELDALGRARALHNFTGNDEREQTLNQLLAELDGFDPSSGVVLLAATNRPEILDPALLRAGRFDRQVLVDRPDRTGRVAILKVHTRKVTLSSDIDLDAVAGLTAGFSGADLANLVNEAAILATRRRGRAIEMIDFENAVERIIAGLERRNRVLNQGERKMIAVHEIGHAMTALALPGTDPVRKVSIIPRGVGALGYTIQTPTEDRYVMRRDELENKICTLLGGRAAEALMFEHISTGAADDLAKATEIARSMVELYGMDDELGHITFQQEQQSFLAGQTVNKRSVSNETAQQIDNAISDIVKSAFDRAFSILRTNRDLLDKTSAALIENETLDEADMRNLKKAIVSEAPVSVQAIT